MVDSAREFTVGEWTLQFRNNKTITHHIPPQTCHRPRPTSQWSVFGNEFAVYRCLLSQYTNGKHVFEFRRHEIWVTERSRTNHVYVNVIWIITCGTISVGIICRESERMGEKERTRKRRMGGKYDMHQSLISVPAE